ncbi:MAG: GTP 3',8-cyclase MoaA, partial [Chloroflexi bacterium]|nr:GTP 3',8-cyclase MoaA [Chloroflexota bacterium]
MADSFARPINYLRISVTDRCNLRCTYCMPSEGIAPLPHEDILRYEEILIVARAAAELGISKVRLTGGEPLVRTDLKELVALLAAVPGIDDIALTTNGVLLARYARELKEAGLKRVNVSLDSLQPEKFKRITRLGNIAEVLGGIERARSAGLQPIKINAVTMRGVNDDEIIDFARRTVEDGWHVRFIEFMPVGERRNEAERRFISIGEIAERIQTLGALEPHKLPGNGPARYYRLPGASGTIGFISPVSEHFCFQCNRLRLTAEGKLRPCLLSDDEIDLRGPIRHGASTDEIKRLIERAIAAKPEGHNLKIGTAPQNRNMCQIG